MKTIEVRCRTFLEPKLNRITVFLDRYEYCVLGIVCTAIGGLLISAILAIFL